MVDNRVKGNYNNTEAVCVAELAPLKSASRSTPPPSNLDNGIVENKAESLYFSDRIALSVEAAAEAISVSKSTMYELVKQKGFPCFFIGKRVLVSRRGLEDWVEQQIKSA